jgi:hypothetical protein
MTTKLLLLYSEKGIAGGKIKLRSELSRAFRASLKSVASLDNNSAVIWYNANSLFGIIIDNTKEKNFGKMKIFPKLVIVVKP